MGLAYYVEGAVLAYCVGELVLVGVVEEVLPGVVVEAVVAGLAGEMEGGIFVAVGPTEVVSFSSRDR